jgi:hypothetical protein
MDLCRELRIRYFWVDTLCIAININNRTEEKGDSDCCPKEGTLLTFEVPIDPNPDTLWQWCDGVVVSTVWSLVVVERLER